MTASEYVSRYGKERKQWPQLTNATRKKIKAEYIAAAKAIADIIRDGELVNGELSFDTQRKLDQAILEGSRAIGDAMREHIPALLTTAAAGYVAIETAFVADAFSDMTSLVTKDGIEKMFAKVARETVQRSLNMPFYTRNKAGVMVSDGLVFWSRVPNISKEFGDDVVNLVRAAINEGRDLGKIAADINKYVKDGKTGTIHRWGEVIEPDSKRLLRRVPEQVDYRALRLARSELGRGLQETAKANGPNNPGGSGWYDWVRINVIDWGCACPSNAANGPYQVDNIPQYDHPNCHPEGTMVMTNRGEIPIKTVLPGDFVVSHDGTWNRVSAKWAEVYEGPMVKIVSNGKELHATPEHPLLTSSGWVPAHSLKGGGNLSGVLCGVESISFRELESKNGPTESRDKLRLFRVLTLLFPRSVPITAIDFDGQLYIGKPQVDAISTDSEVWNGPFPKGFERIVHKALILRPESALIKLGNLETVFLRLGRSSDCIVGRSSIPVPTTSLVASNEAIVNRWECESECQEIPIDANPRNAETLCYSVDREVLFDEEPSKFNGVNVNSFTHAPIVSVSSYLFKGVVHNLTVEKTNSYLANGFSSHNCMCFVRQRMKDGNDFRRELEAWTRGEPNESLDKWYREKYLPGQF